MNSSLDVLGLGIVAVDDLLFVESYPPADSKMPLTRHDRQCGGLTATALVAASRLGARCSYAGVLGLDDLSQFAVERLAAEGVDLSHLVRSAGVTPVHSYIVVDMTGKTRTIIYDTAGAQGAHPTLPRKDVIRTARVLFVDHWGVEGMIRAATIARDAGIPVVADLERDADPRFPELLALCDHLIVTKDFALHLTGERTPERAVRALWSQERSTVVVTGGATGCNYMDSTGHVRHQPAFRVEVVDTTGCGDVFHGAYASALARDLDVPARIEFASAAAALKATKAGGQAGIPSQMAVEAFLRSQR